MLPVDAYQWVFLKLLPTLGGLVGSNTLNANYKPSFLTYLCISGIGSFFFFFVWMCMFEEDTTRVVKCSCTLNLCFQGMIKYWTQIAFSNHIHHTIIFLGTIYKANQKQGTPNFMVVSRWAHYCLAICKVIVGVVSMVGVLMSAAPVCVYVVTGSVEPVLPLYIPGMDETKVRDYILVAIYHVFLLVLAILGTIASDSLQISLVFHMWPMGLILENMLNEMNEAVRNEVSRNSKELRLFVRNIARTHQDICRYNRILSNMFGPQCFVEVNTNGMTLVACLFCNMSLRWPPTYFLSLLTVGKLFAYCVLGTVAELANDRVYNAITMSNWYLLPSNEQIIVQMMIMRAQHPVILKAGVKPLNMDLFVDIMKSVYSVAMLLAETID